MGSQSQASAAYTKFLQYRVEEKIDVLREVQIARPVGCHGEMYKRTFMCSYTYQYYQSYII